MGRYSQGKNLEVALDSKLPLSQEKIIDISNRKFMREPRLDEIPQL